MSRPKFSDWSQATQVNFFAAAIKDLSVYCDKLRAYFLLMGGDDEHIQAAIEMALEHIKNGYGKANDKKRLEEKLSSNGLTNE